MLKKMWLHVLSELSEFNYLIAF